MEHPMLNPNAPHPLVTHLCSGGACGFPEKHPGDHIVDHALVSCLDPNFCALCVYRSRGRAARYGLTPNGLHDIFLHAQERQAARNALRSPAGCLNCPVCHPNHEPILGERVEISNACLRLIQLQTAFERG
jgi:hypothetical protein